ncbi:MAG: hypothetical protein NVS9B4_00650 [Candidatus Acidiferrum sp.]
MTALFLLTPPEGWSVLLIAIIPVVATAISRAYAVMAEEKLKNDVARIEAITKAQHETVLNKIAENTKVTETTLDTVLRTPTTTLLAPGDTATVVVSETEKK